MKKITKWLLISFLVVALFLVRYFESDLFYDPLLDFFKGDFQQNKPPEIDNVKLVLSYMCRFLLNTLISLGIIFLAFQKRSILIFSALFFGALYLILIAVFVYLINPLEKENYFLLYYVRRFIIHPVGLLVLLPSFYYQQMQKKEAI
ncbi:exosortase F system-associated protein [Mesonia sp. K7]|uniref:exosortase F system-associated membrane protein n=1 Tax=Mesonia sp. K7 TaxID=2218606 RepID=UPI000DAA5833|nr:exosortase F system-associated protein [Mesonia sp. K7]PZD76504.1 exosortase F system-associated protein [Mesonia sp. K7]